MSQESTTNNLETMKIESEQEVAKLRDRKALLNKEFEDMKYSGEAKTSRSVMIVCCQHDRIDQRI
jgi:coiled-coil domain-containing protein 151